MFLNKGKYIILNQQRTECRKNQNVQEQNDGDPDIAEPPHQKETHGIAEDKHQGNKQIPFKAGKSKNQAVFKHLLKGKLEGDDHHGNIIFHEREDDKDHENDGQQDILNNPGFFRGRVGVEEPDIKGNQHAEYDVDYAVRQRLFPILLDSVKEVAGNEGVFLSGKIPGDIRHTRFQMCIRDRFWAMAFIR